MAWPTDEEVSIMGLMIECPECKKRNSPKAKTCKCGFALAKFSGRVYWIEYYDVESKRKRERIGPNKAAAEQKLREALSAKAEGRHIKKSKDAKTRFKDLANWYLQLAAVRAKRSYGRDVFSLNRLLPYFKDKLLKDITPALIEAYRQKRLTEPSGRSPKNLTQPATVNREIALMRTIFNKAIANGKAERYPFKGVKQLKENNERDRVLTAEEFASLLEHCPDHVKPIVRTAYYTGMRQGEILNLTWGQVDLKEGFIRLGHESTKTNEGRDVPLNLELIEMFKVMRMRNGVPMPQVRVFSYAGRSLGSIKKAFATAVRKAGIEDFTFHDLRHTAINNWRLQGNDYFRIMAASGHKTMHVFKRYNTVSKEELKALVTEKSGSL
jgi:integrase